MSVLDRSFSTPEDSGFDYIPSFEADALGSGFATGQIIQFFKADALGSGVASGGVYTILKSSPVGQALGLATTYPALQGLATGSAIADGNVDDDVFRATVVGIATGSVTSVTTIQDLRSTMVATASASGSLSEIWSASGVGIGVASGGLYTPLQASGVASSTATGTILLAFRASAIGTATVEGGIDQPDFIQGDALGRGLADGGLSTGLAAIGVGVASATSSSILKQAADLASLGVGTGAGVINLTFLAQDADLAASATGSGLVTALVRAPSRTLQRLQKVRLVHSINRNAL
jgi:hypothetical protein